MKLVGKWGMSKPVIKIEGFYFGAKPGLQCKLWETDFRPVESALPRKGRVVQSMTTISTDDNNPMTALLMSSKVKEPEPAPLALPPGVTTEVLAQGGDIAVTDTPATVGVPLTVAPAKPAVRVVRVQASRK